MDATATDQNTDGGLLAAFARTGNEAPFAALVRRHETMVYNACLRVLHQPSDAEDAAQAVFLALSSKAGDAALHRRASLGGWLYEAAWHVSMRARDAEKLRKQREREAGTMQERLADTAAQWSQLVPVLDGELNALPEKYRLPLVLYHLEQRSVEETAALTQCSADAAKQRLSRGREMLRDRLTRRGVLVSTGIIASLLATHASAATLSGAFAGSTAKAAVLFVSGKTIAGGQAAVLARAAVEATSRPQFARGPLWAAAILLLLGAAACVAWYLFPPPPAAATAPAAPGSTHEEAADAGGRRDSQSRQRDDDLRRQPAPDLEKRVDVIPETRGGNRRALSRDEELAKADRLAKAQASAEAEARAKAEKAKALIEAELRAKEEAVARADGRAEEKKLADDEMLAKPEAPPKAKLPQKEEAPANAAAPAEAKEIQPKAADAAKEKP